MFRCALIGAWHVHFKSYADLIKQRDDCIITCLWDDDAKRGADCAAQYGCNFVADYDTLLSREDVDGILVCSATNQHTDLLMKAAKAKKHIFTEKVLCFTSEDALKIQQAVESAGVKFCISFPKRCEPRVLFAKKAVEENLLGDVYYARVRNAHDGTSTGWLPQHFYNLGQCGGGAMMDLGAHPMYLLQYLLGDPKSVVSMFTNVTGKEVEDNAVSVIEFTNGTIGCSETSFVSKYCPMTIELSGTKGTLFIGGTHNEVIYNVGGKWENANLPQPLKMPIDQWVDGVLYGGEIEYGIEDAVRLTILMEKAYESHITGKKVTF